MNYGKQFEKDFQKSALKYMSYIRLNDPASSFNIDCNGCPKKKTRFAPKHICDAIGYEYPNMYLIELKSSKNKSIPFKNIVRNEKDNRLNKMVDLSNIKGINSFYIFNFRDEHNSTFAVKARYVSNFINTSDRKSIPFDYIKNKGIEIPSYKKRVHFHYYICDLYPF